jgi:chemotaxis family two-component system sensor kinase Cph1
VHLKNLVSELLCELEPETEGRTIEWHIGSLPAMNGDEALLRVVFTNLLSNAVKYTRTRTLAIIELDGSINSNQATIRIRDNGVGLVSVRRIVERHGGHVFAEGENDKGAVITLTLPAAG